MSSDRYISTRGGGEGCDFAQVLLQGLAPDGGLYVPEELPHYDAAALQSMRGLGYGELAARLLRPFVGDALGKDRLGEIVAESYAAFRHPAVTPLVQLGPNHWVLELFHGPTLAFKDVALQLLGRLLDAVLLERGQPIVVLGATSGDTGSAAIAACRHVRMAQVVMLHPEGRIAQLQRRQMTTQVGDNVHNIALQGDFDDCQRIVKSCFREQSFLPPGWQLVAVNSINWARIMAQTVYYFFAVLSLGALGYPCRFSIPTGNFGNAYAAYLAGRMGLPMEKPLLAVNSNDVLHRYLHSGRYGSPGVTPTLAPSMDIRLPSNFERLLFDLYQRDAAQLRRAVKLFGTEDQPLGDGAWQRARQIFDSASVDDEGICAAIQDLAKSASYVLDPHSAVAWEAARRQGDGDGITVILATAHPGKFPELAQRTGCAPPPAALLEELSGREERCLQLPAEEAGVRAHLEKICRNGV